MSVALILLKRFWYAIPMLGLAIALMLSNRNLSNARKVIQSDADFRHTLQVRLGAPNDQRPTIYEWVDATLATNANQRDTLEQISREAKTAHEQSVAADEALKQAQAENAKRFAAAQRTIAELQARKSTGNRDEDWKILEVDTQAPWKDWK